MTISNDNINYNNVWQELAGISNQAVLIVSLIHLGMLLRENGNKLIFGPLGIGVDEFEALFIISHYKGVRPTDIVKKGLMRPAKITRVLDRLEEMGATKRVHDTSDRRSFILEITKTGQQLLERAKDSFRNTSKRPFMALDDKEYQALLAAVLKILNYIGAKENESNNNIG